MAVRRVESERRETNQKAALDLIAEYQYLIRRLELAEDTGAAIPPLIQDELDSAKSRGSRRAICFRRSMARQQNYVQKLR